MIHVFARALYVIGLGGVGLQFARAIHVFPRALHVISFVLFFSLNRLHFFARAIHVFARALHVIGLGGF